MVKIVLSFIACICLFILTFFVILGVGLTMGVKEVKEVGLRGVIISVWCGKDEACRK
jgi:hypothetical protein